MASELSNLKKNLSPNQEGTELDKLGPEKALEEGVEQKELGIELEPQQEIELDSEPESEPESKPESEQKEKSASIEIESASKELESESEQKEEEEQKEEPASIELDSESKEEEPASIELEEPKEESKEEEPEIELDSEQKEEPKEEEPEIELEEPKEEPEIELEESKESELESESESEPDMSSDSESEPEQAPEQNSDSEPEQDSDSDANVKEDNMDDTLFDEINKNKITNYELYDIFKYNINNVPKDSKILENSITKLKTKKDVQYFFNAMELLNKENISNNIKYDYLYPHLDDELLSVKIFGKKEFNEHQYHIDTDKLSYESIEEEANKICNQTFDLAPHQKFIKNFLSSYTPYNSVFLYHGLGTGKTCSAISIAEETRQYMKEMGINSSTNNSNKRIIIVCSQNVQANFKKQLFDENKLEFVNNRWTINNCAGINLLDEINMLKQNISREKVLKIVANIIDNYYVFYGYVKFANEIANKCKFVEKDKYANLSLKQRNILIKNKIDKFFSNRLIIIDEFHNIREKGDDTNKFVAKEVSKLIKNVSSMKMVLMSATPMYNDVKEIIYIANILNMNDNKGTIEMRDVFDKEGNFLKNGSGEEIGLDLLKRKLNGYFSYVKGDNPLTFPFRILPVNFDESKSILNQNFVYPTHDFNNKVIASKLTIFDIYINSNISDYQEATYNYVIEKLNLKTQGSYKYTDIQKGLQSLNIVFPNNIMENEEERENRGMNLDVQIDDLIGITGLQNIIEYNKANKSNYKIRSGYENIFAPNNIAKYSFKFKNIMNLIENSKGPIIIYSQFVELGLIPFALMLESHGFRRYGTNSLFESPQSEELDVNTYKLKSETLKNDSSKFKCAKYAMITGDKIMNPKHVVDKEINACTNIKNLYGEEIKVILISMAGSEGIDLKYIRQIHILEPWYNINRLEQIIGRGVRNCSHSNLPLKERNVKIYMHGTVLKEGKEGKEAIDLSVYRMAEKKAKQIGTVTRLLKEISIDCYLNEGLLKYSESNLKKIFTEGLDIELSNDEQIKYVIGDKVNSALCDYMESCEYTCSNKNKKADYDSSIDPDNLISYNDTYLEMNNEKIMKIINDLFKEKFFYEKIDLFNSINLRNNFSVLAINNALTELVENNNIFVKDKYDRLGKIQNIGTLYIFQPAELNYPNTSLYDNTTPIRYKQDNLQYHLPLDIKQPQGFKKYKIKPDEADEADKEDDDKSKYQNEPPDIYTARVRRGDNSVTFNKIVEIFVNLLNGNSKKFDSGSIYANISKNIKSNYKNKEPYLNLESLFNTNLDKDDSFNEENNNIINMEYLRIILVHMLYDNLQITEQLEIFQFILNNKKTGEFLYKTEDEKFIYNILQKIFNDLIVSVDDVTGVILPIQNIMLAKKYTLYLIKDKDKDKDIELHLAEPLDYDEFDNAITNKFEFSPQAVSDEIMGFVFKDKPEEDYKLKLRKKEKKDGKIILTSGAICSQAGKINVEKMFLKEILHPKLFENIKKNKLTFTDYCTMTELYLRYYTLIAKNDKIWFSNIIFTHINNLNKIRKKTE